MYDTPPMLYNRKIFCGLMKWLSAGLFHANAFRWHYAAEWGSFPPLRLEVLRVKCQKFKEEMKMVRYFLSKSKIAWGGGWHVC